MFQSLLVPLDQSQFSEHSLPTAIALAGESGADLHLVHVHVLHMPDHMLSNTQYMFEGLDLDEYDRKHKLAEEEYLEDVARRVSVPLRDSPSATLLDGPVPEAIERFADLSSVDLIIITRRGKAGIGGFLRRSVTDTLAREITKPLLVLHPVGREKGVSEPTHFDDVLVCLDGSEACEAILDPVRDIGQLGAHLTLLHIVSVQPSNVPDWQKQGTVDRMEDYLQSVARRLEGDGHSVRIRVKRARRTALGILSVARELQTDVIALGTHGHGRLHRLLLGSVADEVLRNSPLPVLLKKPPSLA